MGGHGRRDGLELLQPAPIVGEQPGDADGFGIGYLFAVLTAESDVLDDAAVIPIEQAGKDAVKPAGQLLMEIRAVEGVQLGIVFSG